MSRIILLSLIILFSSINLISAQEPAIPGDLHCGLWLGTLHVTEQVSLQVAFGIEKDGDSGYTARMNVIEQMAFDIPMNTCHIENDSVLIRMDNAGISYNGKFDMARDSIFGTYSQGGGQFRLDLGRVDKLPVRVNRPQTPVRPFPYEETEVKFENKKAGITLSGTLTAPKGAVNLAAVILVSGSGRNDRNETEMGHFLLLSDFLTRRGYVVLRYDKRGAGESGGDYGAATTFDFADDARVGISFLESRPEVNPQKTGIIGHSEGAIIAPMVAAENGKKVSFIILMGGAGVPGKDLMLKQAEDILKINGAPDDEIKFMLDRNRMYYDLAVSYLNDTLLGSKLREADPEINETIYNAIMWKWYRTFLALDPSVYLGKVKCPVLAITGEKDLQCSAEENLPAIKKALDEGGNRDHEIKMLPGLNHLFQTSATGSPYEYTRLEEIISPDALKIIVDWLDRVTNQ